MLSNFQIFNILPKNNETWPFYLAHAWIMWNEPLLDCVKIIDFSLWAHLISYASPLTKNYETLLERPLVFAKKNQLQGGPYLLGRFSKL